MSSALNPQTLIEHESFVRSVVRGLLPQEARADDIVQETMVRALERPPQAASDGSLRAWLATVARNLTISSQRSKQRRVRRELDVARPEKDTTWQDTVQRVETRQRVAETVLSLEEPYRSVVLLRYEHDLSASEIGKRLDSSAATVRSQLSRAHTVLREKLDAEFGDRRDWALLALPFALPAPTANPWLAKLGAIAAGGVAVAAAIGVWSWTRPRPELITPERVALETNAAQELAGEPRGAARATNPRADAASSTTPAAVRSVDVLLPRVELFDRSKFDDYELATFSFEHGLRDDLDIVRNDWCLQLTRATFNTRMVADDQSFIIDLGQTSLAAVVPGLLDGRDGSARTPARLGHSYVVWTRDRQTDVVGAFEVLELGDDGRCTLDWYTVNAHGQGSGSFVEDDAGPRLKETLEALRPHLTAGSLLTEARVLLQVRSDGSPCRINMAGEAIAYIGRLASEPLDLQTPVDTDEESAAYFEGGFIPPGQKFLVRRAEYRGTATGDSNGHGDFRISLGDELLVDQKDDSGAINGVWQGEVELKAGDEGSVFLEISSTSAGEVVFDGEFVPLGEDARPGALLASGQALVPVAQLPRPGRLDLLVGAVTSDRFRSADISYYGGFLSVSSDELFDLGDVDLGAAGADLLHFPPLKRRSIPRRGHSYFFEPRRGGACVFRITDLSSELCKLDWFSVDRIGHTSGSYRDDGGAMIATLTAMRSLLHERRQLRAPLVQLQLRAGTVGGRIDMRGKSKRLTVVEQPLDVFEGPSKRDREAYAAGGLIPSESVFVVTQVSYSVRAGKTWRGDSKHAFKIRIGNEDVVEYENVTEELDASWFGRIELRPGDEASVFIEATYETVADVEIRGTFVE